MEPTVISGDPPTLPREIMPLMMSKFALLGSTSGGSAPNTGTYATMTLTRGSIAPTTITWPPV